MVNENQSTILLIKDAQRKNTGKYEVTARNACATKSMDLNVEILDKPSAPAGPIIFSSIFDDKLTVFWQECSDNGGSPVQYYVIEKRDTTRLNWSLVSVTFKTDHFLCHLAV